MTKSGKIRKRALLAFAVLTLIVALVAPPPAAAQGCSMCYSSAQQQTAGQARALNFGILILLVPSLLMFAGVLVTAVRRRDQE